MDYKCCKTEKSRKNLGKTVEFLKIISEENRLKILCLLQEDEMCVCDIWRNMSLAQNLVSHHLKILKNFGLLRTRREGAKIIYSLKKSELEKYTKLLARYINIKK